MRTLFAVPFFLVGALCVALDSRADTLYVSDIRFVDNEIHQVTAGGAVSTFTALPAGNGTYGLAFDAAGNLFVANRIAGTISEITPGGSVSTFATGLGSLTGLAFGGTDLYVASANTNTILKVTPGGTVSTFATGVAFPFGLAFDGNGNLFAANFLQGKISQITPGGVVSTFATLPAGSDPFGLAFAANGNLFVSDEGLDKIFQITPGAVVSTFVSLASDPVGLTFASNGNLYVGLTGSPFSTNPAIYEITPAGAVSTFKDYSSAEFISITFLVAHPVPEPSTWTLAVLGAVGLAFLVSGQRRRARRAT